jgi:ubiquinone/menaquinone biosynthesis C-methylase UbiE
MAWDMGWDTLFEKHGWGQYPPEELIRFIARNFSSRPDRKSVKILEVGCGPGANIWFLCREGYSTYGIDGSQVAIGLASERLKKEGLIAELHTGDITRIPFPDNFFDAVIDIECIYANTLKDSKIIMGEIDRVLKPGGIFFSKTFMTGTYGDGKGERVPDEPHTYKNLKEGALRQGYGIIRFTSEDDIKDLYSRFDIASIDYLVQSRNNRRYEIKEWLIECKKKG